jgi:signal peptidase I
MALFSESKFGSRLKRHRHKRFFWVNRLLTILVVLIVSVGIRMYAYEPFDVLGPSMQPTLTSGELVLVNKWKYRFSSPERGDIVIFHALEERDYIKRVIALPGETIEVKNKQLLINGKPVSEPYLPESVVTHDFPAVKVPTDKIFVLGDNRENSRDSRARELGPVSQTELVGKVELIYWPFQNWQVLK